MLETKNKFCKSCEFFDAEKHPSKNRKNALDHRELTTKKPSKPLWKSQTPMKNARKTEEIGSTGV
jgi:hypothetical protein